jgi:hypothetical protein
VVSHIDRLDERLPSRWCALIHIFDGAPLATHVVSKDDGTEMYVCTRHADVLRENLSDYRPRLRLIKGGKE